MYGQRGVHRVHSLWPPGRVQRLCSLSEKVPHLQRHHQGHGAHVSLLNSTDPWLRAQHTGGGAGGAEVQGHPQLPMELEASLDCMRHCLGINQETHGQTKNEGKRNTLPKLKKEWINYVIFLTLTLIWSPKKCYLFPSQKAVFVHVFMWYLRLKRICLHIQMPRGGILFLVLKSRLPTFLKFSEETYDAGICGSESEIFWVALRTGNKEFQLLF